MTEPQIQAAPHEHPWAEDEGPCILVGVGISAFFVGYFVQRLAPHTT